MIAGVFLVSASSIASITICALAILFTGITIGELRHHGHHCPRHELYCRDERRRRADQEALIDYHTRERFPVKTNE